MEEIIYYDLYIKMFILRVRITCETSIMYKHAKYIIPNNFSENLWYIYIHIHIYMHIYDIYA